MKTYRRHSCSRQHGTYHALARCIWARAAWVQGEGPYATLAHCRVLTVQLHDTLDVAEQWKHVIDSSGCGGACQGAPGHEIVRLADPGDATQW